MTSLEETGLTTRYDAASGLWPDKMRVLGYYDAYLGFLSHRPDRAGHGTVLDAGAGTAAMSEAWVAVNGAPERLTLLDPSQAMLDRGRAALLRRAVAPECVAAPIAEDAVAPHDVVLAAHVIEHLPNAEQALATLGRLTKPGGELWLVVSKPHWCNAIIWLQWRHKTYRDAQVKAYLDWAGFELIDTYAFPSGPPSRTSRGYLARRR